MRHDAPIARVLLLVLVAAPVGVATAFGHAGHAASTTALVLPGFEATVHQGPDTGLSLGGTLRLRYDRAGVLTGLLAPRSGQALPVSGQLNGLAINLVFYLGHGKHVFGVGTVGRDPGARGGFVGGPLVGPNKADAGDWYADDLSNVGAVAHGSQFGD